MKPGKDYIGVGCGAFIINEKRQLLLQQRNKEPEKGFWCIPGGKVEWMETFENAIKREVKEECDIKQGEPKIMEPSKHSDMKWFDLGNLPKNITITTQDALKAYLDNK